MRRFWFALLAVGFLGAFTGCCHHVAGVCDCGEGCHAPATLQTAEPPLGVMSIEKPH
jgi:hypothetical protein